MIAKSGIVRLDEHRERTTRRLDPGLVHVPFDERERPQNCGIDSVTVGLAFDIREWTRSEFDCLSGRGVALFCLWLSIPDDAGGGV